MIGWCNDCDDEVEIYDDGESWCCDVCEGDNVDENDADDWDYEDDDDDDEDWDDDDE